MREREGEAQVIMRALDGACGRGWAVIGASVSVLEDPSGTRDTGSGRGSKGLKTSGTVRVRTLFRWEEKKKFITADSIFSDQGEGLFFRGRWKAWRGAPSSCCCPGAGVGGSRMRRAFWRTGLTEVPRGYCVGTGCVPVASKVRETGRICMKSRYSRGTWKGEEA